MDTLDNGSTDHSGFIGRLLFLAAGIFHFLQTLNFGQIYDICFKVLTIASLAMACAVYYKKLKRK